MGKLKTGPEYSLIAEYQKRLKTLLTLKEIKQSSKEAEALDILAILPEKAYLILLDERGENLPSVEFAALIQKASLHHKTIIFVIGGADGVAESIKKRADFILSFGKLTWPHMLVRVMATEQIYRALSILNNHPYHRA